MELFFVILWKCAHFLHWSANLLAATNFGPIDHNWWLNSKLFGSQHAPNVPFSAKIPLHSPDLVLLHALLAKLWSVQDAACFDPLFGSSGISLHNCIRDWLWKEKPGIARWNWWTQDFCECEFKFLFGERSGPFDLVLLSYFIPLQGKLGVCSDLKLRLEALENDFEAHDYMMNTITLGTTSEFCLEHEMIQDAPT